MSSPRQPERTYPVSDGILRGRLFVSSYAPLFAILAARSCPGVGDPDEPLWPFIVSGVLAVWGLADGWWLIRASTHRNAISIVVLDLQEQGSAAAGYLPTYLLPFIASGPQSIGGWIGYGIYFAVLFVVFLGSDFALVNPTLYVLGRRVVRATIEQQPVDPDDGVSRREILVITRHLPQAGESILVTRLSGCWVERDAADDNR